MRAAQSVPCVLCCSASARDPSNMRKIKRLSCRSASNQRAEQQTPDNIGPCSLSARSSRHLAENFLTTVQTFRTAAVGMVRKKVVLFWSDATATATLQRVLSEGHWAAALSGIVKSCFHRNAPDLRSGKEFAREKNHLTCAGSTVTVRSQRPIWASRVSGRHTAVLAGLASGQGEESYRTASPH